MVNLIRVSKPLLPILRRNSFAVEFRNLNFRADINTSAGNVREGVVNPKFCNILDIDNLKYPAIVSTSKSVFERGSLFLSHSDDQIPGHATKKMFREFAKHVSWEDAQGFLDTLPTTIDDILGSQPQFQIQGSSTFGLSDRLRRLLGYNLVPLTQFCAMQTLAVNTFYNNSSGLIQDSLLDTHTTHGPSSQLTNKDKTELAYRLGWCAEFMYAQFLILDDLVDGSTMRFGKNCWYLTLQNFPQSAQENDGPNRASSPAAAASYDAILLQNIAHALLQIYFGGQTRCGRALEELFHYVMHSTHGGMALEVEENAKFHNYGRLCSMETYLNYRRIQNGLISSYFPIAAAAILHDVANPKILKELESACSDIFLFYAITRDYVDCYSDVSFMGSDGTDIQNGRITWLLIAAMERASPLQQAILKKNVGQPSRENVERAMEIYAELKLLELLKNWQIQFYEKSVKNIQKLSPDLPRAYLKAILDIFNNHMPH